MGDLDARSALASFLGGLLAWASASGISLFCFVPDWFPVGGSWSVLMLALADWSPVGGSLLACASSDAGWSLLGRFSAAGPVSTEGPVSVPVGVGSFLEGSMSDGFLQIRYMLSALLQWWVTNDTGAIVRWHIPGWLPYFWHGMTGRFFLWISLLWLFFSS